MNLVRRVLDAVDAAQRRRPWLAFPAAVYKKFSQDRGSSAAALIAYYGFLSMFPLLLVLASVLDIVLANDPALRARILETTLGSFPVVGEQLRVPSPQGSGLAIGVGAVIAIWAGLRVLQNVQRAMNDVWGVPREHRPNFWQSRLRSLAILGVLGTATLGSTLLSGIGSAPGAVGVFLRVGGLAASLVLNFGVFAVSYRVLVRTRLRWADVAPGAAAGTIGWTVLQTLGGFLVTHQIQRATPVYGTLALVIGLLGWLYLGGQVVVYGAEVNAVRARRLWPRSLFSAEPEVEIEGPWTA